MAEIPEKRAGAHYTVVLRSSDPARLDFGRRCVCCDREPAPTVEFRGKGVGVPVCDGCRAHLGGRTGLTLVLGTVIFGLGAGVLYEVATARWIHAVGLGLGLVIAIIGAREQLEKVTNGHHSSFGITVRPGRCFVRTQNRRVVAELVGRHGDQVDRIR